MSVEKAMATHSSTLASKIPWIEEPGRLQSIGSLRVGHDWATSLSFSLSCIGEGNGTPLQCSCLVNPRGSGAWRAAVYGVTQSRTRLKRLSSSSSSRCLTSIVLGPHGDVGGDIHHIKFPGLLLKHVWELVVLLTLLAPWMSDHS